MIKLELAREDLRTILSALDYVVEEQSITLSKMKNLLKEEERLTLKDAINRYSDLATELSIKF